MDVRGVKPLEYGNHPQMNRTLNRQADASQVAGRLLAIYLRDHRAGATAGLRLVRRCRDANAGSDMGEMLSTLEQEIRLDCEVLEAVMAHLGVRPSRFKAIIAGAAEVAGRLKSNGSIMRRSPSSTVVELEALAAGIITKRNLWRALRAITPDDAGRTPRARQCRARRPDQTGDGPVRARRRRARPSSQGRVRRGLSGHGSVGRPALEQPRHSCRHIPRSARNPATQAERAIAGCPGYPAGIPRAASAATALGSRRRSRRPVSGRGR